MNIIREQQLITVYTKVLSIGNFHSACRNLNERVAPDNMWDNFKIHFAAAHRQHNKMQVESAATSGYANAVVYEDDLAEAVLDAFANLTTAAAVDHGIVATLTGAKSRLVMQSVYHIRDTSGYFMFSLLIP
jgi:hypothetical protein